LCWQLRATGKSRLLARLASLAALALFLVCTGCSPNEHWHLLDVKGHLPDLKFYATSDQGAPIDARNLRGSTVLVYFGFTRCSEECPLVMQRLSGLIDSSGLGPHTRILFVSLDPKHDSPQLLHNYLAAFRASGAIGITASPDVIERLAKRYRIAFYPSGTDGLDPRLPHSTAVYVFDAEGHARLLLQPGDADSDAVTDIRRVVASVS